MASFLMQSTNAFIILLACVNVELVIRYWLNCIVSLRRSCFVILTAQLWVLQCSGDVLRYHPSTEWYTHVPHKRGTWVYHSVDGWYLNTSSEHYRTHNFAFKMRYAFGFLLSMIPLAYGIIIGGGIAESVSFCLRLTIASSYRWVSVLIMSLTHRPVVVFMSLMDLDCINNRAQRSILRTDRTHFPKYLCCPHIGILRSERVRTDSTCYPSYSRETYHIPNYCWSCHGTGRQSAQPSKPRNDCISGDSKIQKYQRPEDQPLESAN